LGNWKLIQQLTEDSLGIFWNGEEVIGITIYGYFEGTNDLLLTFDESIWNHGIQLKSNTIRRDNWIVGVWDIKVNKWPNTTAWPKVIQESLKEFTNKGAVLSWAAFEGFFVEPPRLLDPRYMSGGVWAIYSNADGFYCSAQLGQKIEFISDDVLEKFRTRIKQQNF